MKTLILALLTAALFAAPAFSHDGQPKSLLISTTINITMSSANSLGYCFPLGTEYYVLTYCSQQYGGWLVPRDLTITEIQVNTVTPTEDMAGICGLYVKEDTNGDEDWTRAEAVAGPYFVDGRGAALSDPAGVSRHEVDLDFERGDWIGFALDNYGDYPANCNSETTDPVFQLQVWGYYTD